MAAAALAAGGMGALGVGVGMGSRGVVGVDAALAPLAQLARLFVASALPVLKVAMLCGAGALASAQVRMLGQGAGAAWPRNPMRGARCKGYAPPPHAQPLCTLTHKWWQ